MIEHEEGEREEILPSLTRQAYTCHALLGYAANMIDNKLQDLDGLFT